MKNQGMKQIQIAAMLLALALLAGCGTEASENSSGGSQADAVQETDSKGADTAEETETEKADAGNEEVTFEELTVVDNDACTVQITGYDPDGSLGYTMDVYLENKTDGTTLMYAVSYGAVNGLDSDPFWAEEVAPGKKSNSQIYWAKSTLKDYGIEKPSDFELAFRVYDNEDWSADAVAETVVHVYPYGEEQAEVFTREAGADDVILVDNDQVKATVVGCEMDEIWGYTVRVFLENRTDASAMFSVDEASVNGYMMDPFWATSIPAGKCGFSDIQFSNSDFEDNGITEVEEIEFLFRARDDEDYSGDYYAEESCTLKP